jgi:monoamine oxidase
MIDQDSKNPDVVVVGAGAAGIGAGLALSRMGISHVILEAKQRIGGRAYSDASSIGHLWDHGCHWFHSADKNLLRFIAEKIGHKFPAAPRDGNLQTFTKSTWIKTADREDYVWGLLGKIAETGKAGRDVAASTLLDKSHAWYPMIRHWCQLMYSMDPENISTGDAGNYSDSGVNLPVEEGYGALIEKISRGLPIHLNNPVKSIEILPKTVRIETVHGTVKAKACILAVPASIFEHGHIQFKPHLPEELLQAFQDVPMGNYEKVAIAFDCQVFEGFKISFADVFDPEDAATRPVNFELHPFGRHIAVAHFGGSVARELATQGEGAMKDFALESLVRAFGDDIHRRVVGMATTTWTNDPYIGGAYSCAKPGKAHVRKAFSEPVHERVFLAGEHVHQHYMATAHGAYETGLEAAQRAAAAIGYPPMENHPQWLPS